MVLPACLVRLIRRAKLPSSRLVRRAWLLPNTPRRVRLPARCLVGRARQPIGRRQTSWRAAATWLTALGCRWIRRAIQPLPARPPPPHRRSIHARSAASWMAALGCRRIRRAMQPLPARQRRRQCKLARARSYFDNSLFRFYSTVVKCASQLASRQHRRCLLWCLNHSTTIAQCTFYY